MAAAWFRRLGDVPGLDYSPPVVVDRNALPRHDATPENRDDLPASGYLSWGTVWEPIPPEEREEDDDEDAEWTRDLGAPVTDHLRAYVPDDSGVHRLVRPDGPATPRLLQRLWEGLELPGRPYDYHAAIEHVREMLYPRRLDEPVVLEAVESLAWLDIRLVLACPYAVLVETAEGDEHFYGMSAFGGLIRIYRTEGFMREALEVAELAERFPSPPKRLADLQARLETMRGETVGLR
jgi:hypothetical protein